MRRPSWQKFQPVVPPCAASHPSCPSACCVGSRRLPRRRALSLSYVMLLSALVHCWWPAIATSGATPPGTAVKGAPVGPVTAPLPPAAQDMYEAIVSAVHSGDIEDLKIAFDLGELKADIADEPVSDPVTYWKQLSNDGDGREILAIIANLFAVGPAEVARGKDPENPSVFVWPYVAELPLDKLTPAQKVDLLRVVTAAEAKSMTEQKTYTGWRLTIGADGLWHAFKKGK